MPDTKNKAAQALGRLGGAANTPAQQRARRRNAQFAGRPRRVCTSCGEPVAGGHVDRRLDDVCGQHGWRWQQGAQAPESPEKDLLRAVLAALPPTTDPELLRRLRAAIRSREPKS